ncbi:DHHC palmitoyltransferase-domain-containing protein [Geranomyces variabilis]|nr:DHHC palmitoyltransferase-domain-containing protein [Geranomyces variabilis]KAJ3134080.1 hypothetical protein HDU90_005428 [Geranomyces variabilis]
MFPLVQVVAYIGIFALFVFILLFGESSYFREGPVGAAHAVLTQRVPFWIHKFFILLCGKTLVRRCDAAATWCAESRNPLFQIFFLVLLTSGVWVFLITAWGRIFNAGGIHILLAPLSISSVYASFLRACWSDPGTLTAANVAKAQEIWPYDEILFREKECRTCHFVKPARSKHCALCGICVAKSDHHCAWINNCVGHNNFRFFLAFLATTVTMCFYGAYLAYHVFVLEMRVQQVDMLVVYDHVAGTRVPLTREQKWMYMIHRELLLTALGMFCICAGVVVVAFMLYQLSLIAARGITTNESFKWDDVAYDVKEGVVHLPRRVLECNRRGLSPTTRKAPSPPPASAAGGGGGKAGGGGGVARKRKQQQQRVVERKARDKQKQEEMEERNGDGDELVTIRSVTELRNIYHLGWWRNLLDVLFPVPLD